MTSKLAEIIPVLTGANYLDWVSPMEDFLMAQGLSGALYDDEPTPVDLQAPTAEEKKDLREWLKDDREALGYIRLRISPALRVKHAKHTNAIDLWNTLQADYGAPGC
jgi:hypothetical protein